MSEVMASSMTKKGRKAMIGFQSQLSSISVPNRLILAQSSPRGTSPVSSNQAISLNDDTSRVTTHAIAIEDAFE
jgi:hypothetical protein